MGQPLDAVKLLADFNHEDCDWDDQAEQEPDIDELEVSCPGQAQNDSLVQGVHNQQNSEGEADGYLDVDL